MILQNINLLPDSYFEKKIPFNGMQIIQLTVGLLLIMCLLILGQYWSFYKSQKKSTLLDSSNQSINNQLATFLANHKKPEIDQKIQDKINLIQSNLVQNKQLNSKISQIITDKQQGFSAYLEALAAQHIEGIWLNEINIADDGKRLILSGSTIAASRVPEYLERLKVEKIFQGKVFDKINFERDNQDQNIVNFIFTIGNSDEKVAKK